MVDDSSALFFVRTPQLEITYFQPRDVQGDDPFTENVESPIPFTLGVLVKNSGYGLARSLKINSQQPKIVENKRNLLLVAQLMGSRVMDSPLKNADLLVDLGDINPGQTRKAAWDMITSLSGEFELVPPRQCDLILYGRPWTGYAIESSPSFTPNPTWSRLMRVPLTGTFQVIEGIEGNSSATFYRAYELAGSPPILDLLMPAGPAPYLILYGTSGKSYQLLTTSALSEPIQWNSAGLRSYKGVRAWATPGAPAFLPARGMVGFAGRDAGAPGWQAPNNSCVVHPTTTSVSIRIRTRLTCSDAVKYSRRWLEA